MKDSIAIVVPVWNQAALLERLLATVSRQTRKPEQVIIVDSGSTDNAAEVASVWGADVVAMGENRGFAAAANRGIAHCSAEWVALINSDVELNDDWLEKLLQAAVETDAWFCCGKLMASSDRARIDGTWDLIAISGCPLRAGHGQKDSSRFACRRTIAMAPATAAVYRKDLFTLIGGFDEEYESYLEDVDFSLRCAVRGFMGTFEPGAVAYHVGGASGGRMVHLYARNQILLVRKLFPLKLQRKFRIRILWGRLLWGALALRHGAFAAWVSGIASGLRTRVQPAPLEPERLEELLLNSESEIKSLNGSDTYWRLYFLFPRGESG